MNRRKLITSSLNQLHLTLIGRELSLTRRVGVMVVVVVVIADHIGTTDDVMTTVVVATVAEKAPIATLAGHPARDQAEAVIAATPARVPALARP